MNAVIVLLFLELLLELVPKDEGIGVRCGGERSPCLLPCHTHTHTEGQGERRETKGERREEGKQSREEIGLCCIELHFVAVLLISAPVLLSVMPTSNTRSPSKLYITITRGSVFCVVFSGFIRCGKTSWMARVRISSKSIQLNKQIS